ncbi:hypothetical protein NCAS_0A01170 [Naumovozyma castellii]|uniref:Thiaminase-2/PQQC domain-containing protein n=1 Tax=Naumovozyma castellii TaxID=27288 RepID=G0V5E1_NAUCA|nr:hypothetical protein NCAS_0A01170 [Naumovozyma castellii CBS 4309]CCC66677.1 hypothetical protein NCAS_0A01170 [Naumovozyma castellii CBS 4309]
MEINICCSQYIWGYFFLIFKDNKNFKMITTTKQLLAKHKDIYKKATEHEVTNKLCQGTLSDRVFYAYLAQDLQFFEVGMRLLCKIALRAPRISSFFTLSKTIGFFASDENTYFHDCLAVLAPSLSSEDKATFDNTLLPGVDIYVRYMEELTKGDFTYAQLITCHWAGEQIYLQWAQTSRRKTGLHWKYQIWIDLHDSERFRNYVDFLANEVNQFPVEEVEEVFIKVVELEFEFFDRCYKA